MSSLVVIRKEGQKMAKRAMGGKRKPRPTFSVSTEYTITDLAFESAANAILPSYAADEVDERVEKAKRR